MDMIKRFVTRQNNASKSDVTIQTKHNNNNKHYKHNKHNKHNKPKKDEIESKTQIDSIPHSSNRTHRQKYNDEQGALLHVKYQIGKEIGRGSDGIVKLCRLRKNWLNKNQQQQQQHQQPLDSNDNQVNNNNSKHNKNHFKNLGKDHQTRAIKVIDKTKLNPTHLKDIHNEIKILEQLSKQGHDNILRCYETFDIKNKVYIVTELLGGDTLEARIVKKFNTNNNIHHHHGRQQQVAPGFDEIERAVIFYQLLEGLSFLHDLNIVHRDFKPENILFSKDGVNTVKIIDFGLAGLLTKHNNFKLSHPCGTPFYVAPEVIDPRNKQKYDTKVDMWSAGVILYAMCCGHLPFKLRPNEPLTVLYKQIIKGKVLMISPNWSYIADDAKDLVLSLMNKDPYQRLSAKDALDHPWFRRVFSNFVDKN